MMLSAKPSGALPWTAWVKSMYVTQTSRGSSSPVGVNVGGAAPADDPPIANRTTTHVARMHCATTDSRTCKRKGRVACANPEFRGAPRKPGEFGRYRTGDLFRSRLPRSAGGGHRTLVIR